MILVCVGRKPVMPAIENIDLRSEKDKLEVDDYLKTTSRISSLQGTALAD